MMGLWNHASIYKYDSLKHTSSRKFYHFERLHNSITGICEKNGVDVLGPTPNVKLLPQLRNFTICRNSKEIESCNSYRLIARAYA